MKRIAIYLAILITMLIVADRILFFVFTKYIFSKTFNGDTGGSVNYIIQKKKDADFFILGSSRAKHHIDPALLTAVYNGNGYNAGKNGFGGIVYNDMLLQLLISKNIKPKMILLQVDPQYFLTTGTEDLTGELLPLYPFMGGCKKLNDFIYTNTNYAEKFKLLFQSYSLNGKFFGVLYNYAKRGSFKDNNGFESLNGTIDTSRLQAPEPPGEYQKFSAIKINVLHDIVQACNINKIKLGVVFSPTYNNSGFLKQATDTITQILHTQGPVTIYDLSDIKKIPSLQPASLWRNASHLNGTGAAIFSKLLNEAMRKQ